MLLRLRADGENIYPFIYAYRNETAIEVSRNILRFVFRLAVKSAFEKSSDLQTCLGMIDVGAKKLRGN